MLNRQRQVVCFIRAAADTSGDPIRVVDLNYTQSLVITRQLFIIWTLCLFFDEHNSRIFGTY